MSRDIILAVGSRVSSEFNKMSLPSGIYTIRNVKHRNWAILLNGNDEGEVVAGSSDTPNVGEKVGS
jgi:hypothetical protein